MRRITLIDGENLNYAIRTFLGSSDSLAPRSVLLDIDYRSLLVDALGEDDIGHIVFFGVRMKKIDTTDVLAHDTARNIHEHSKLVNILQQQGISFSKIGNLRARETKPCIKCGDTQWHLVEKGVDVGIAVKMLEEADSNTEFVLVSSDTDLLPAVRAVKRAGARFLFLGYDFRPILSLTREAHITRLITKSDVVRNFKGKS